MSTELKPCPFCGGEASMVSDAGYFMDGNYVRCLECEQEFVQATAESAAAVWNRRDNEIALRPIDTAPKDGTRFLGAEYDADEGWMIGIYLWCKTSHVPLYGFHLTGGDPEDMNIANPSHWMPLPTPPTPTHPQLPKESAV